MNIQLIEKPFRYVVIDDFYDEAELKLVREEILAFEPYGSAATTAGGLDHLKSGSGLFLDHMFSRDRSRSKILTANRKLFCDEIHNEAVKLDASFGQLRNCDKDCTLINYYHSGEEYKPHTDRVVITAVTFFAIGSFTGGDFYFPAYKETVQFKENRLVMFPSCVFHQALPIKADDNSCRVSIAQFLDFKPSIA